MNAAARRLVLAALLAAALATAVQASAAAPALRKIALTPAQVGAGYRVAVIPGGTSVQGQVTLDLCGFVFPSEQLRVARLQVVYRKSGTALALSNEVVRYEPGGAQQALREVAHAASHCPRGPVASSVAGVPPLTYRIAKIADDHLLPGSVALRVHFSGTFKGKTVAETAIVVYQAKANVLSGVYTNGSGAVAVQQAFGLRAAEQSAANLRRLA
jgi:hypothetical protein